MPGRNGKGPNGDGPRTGRGLGNCGRNKDLNQKDTKRGGRGPGDGIGFFGRGRRNVGNGLHKKKVE